MWRFAYQPIWDLVKQEVIAYESLMRPSDGSPPTDVLRRYRDNNQVVSLDQALLVHAMDDARTLLEPHQVLMVNAEPETLDVISFWERWSFPLPPEKVVVEITERASIENVPVDVFGRLGIRLALDDFGTGTSNLLAFERIQPAYVKMNRDFLHSHDDSGMLAMMANQCARTQTQLIVEGVEDESDLAFLHRIHVRYAQGFYLGKPRFPEEYEKGSVAQYVAHWN